mmetsp:Transcript_79918/g.222307  ORF Transcript_79918/g.222307 Transcript_79918/m.222307 type:complete len:179 (-) Transcript_79918:8-544(-)
MLELSLYNRKSMTLVKSRESTPTTQYFGDALSFPSDCFRSHLFQLLLWAQLRSVSTLLLAAVSGARRKAGIAFSANGFVAVELLCQESQRRVVDTSTKSQNQMQGGLLLDVIIAQSAPIFQLLSSEDQTLLIGRNSLLVLNLRLDIVDGVRRLDIERDGLARQGLYEDLHGYLIFPRD